MKLAAIAKSLTKKTGEVTAVDGMNSPVKRGKWFVFFGFNATTQFLVFLLFSFFFWSFIVIKNPEPIRRFSSQYSDHYSHYMAAIVVWYRGWEVCQKPIRYICTDRDRSMVMSTAERLHVKSVDVCNIPERAHRRPLVINWTENPRAYPIGVYFYMFPEAWLYENTCISFQTLNKITLMKFLLVAHFLLMLLFSVLYGKTVTKSERLSPAWMMTGIVLVPLLYYQILWWTLMGFYDGISVFFIVLAFFCMIKKDWNVAFFSMSCAVFLHYRALWYLPLFFIIGWNCIKEKSWREKKIRTWALYILSFIFIVGSAAGFFILFPLLVSYEHTNPLHLDVFHRHAAHWMVKFGLPFLIIVAYTAVQKKWKLLLLMAWQVFMIAQAPQAEWWHVLFLLPLFTAARLEGAKFHQFAAVFLLFMLEAAFIFHYFPPWVTG